MEYHEIRKGNEDLKNKAILLWTDEKKQRK